MHPPKIIVNMCETKNVLTQKTNPKMMWSMANESFKVIMVTRDNMEFMGKCEDKL